MGPVSLVTGFLIVFPELTQDVRIYLTCESVRDSDDSCHIDIYILRWKHMTDSAWKQRSLLFP